MALSASWQSPAPSAGAASDRQRRRRAFHAARRHSRLVRRLRFLLPAAGVLTVLAFAGATRFSLPDNLDLSAARLSVTPSSIIMDRPHLKGFDEANKEFSVMADRAVQSLANPNSLRLENITAKIGPDGDPRTTMTAESGDYDRSKSTMLLHGAVTIDFADGSAVRMTDADINLDAGTMVSPNAVVVTKGADKTTGKSISVTGSGDVVVLEGDVRTTLTPARRGRASSSAVEAQVRP